MSIVSFAILEGFRSVQDGTLKVTVAFNEMKPEQSGKIFSLINKAVTVAISEQAITDDVLKGIDEVKPELPAKEPKSQSQRLRAVFYRIWETNPTSFETANAHYEYMMERVIEHYKTKIKD